MDDNEVQDSVIVGAGPAGLSAALYLARYLRRPLVLHDGTARAARIPESFNVPGFPGGVCGADLLARMTGQAEQFGARLIETKIVGAERSGDHFALQAEDGHRWTARTLILATGIELHQVDMPTDQHEAAIRAGVLRYCPICDGFEYRDKRIVVVGCDEQGAAEALFMRHFSEQITLVPRAFSELDPATRAELERAGIAVIERRIACYAPSSEAMVIYLEGLDEPLNFDLMVPGLGVTPRAELARQLGVAVNHKGCCDERALFDSGVPGLWVAGDVLEGLDQISVAIGHGAIAATRAHNWLREQDGETL
jgi:thioredoxin reductase (NADPH)